MAASSLSVELVDELHFNDPRCLALEVAKMAHDHQAPAVDCVLAGLRRLIEGPVSRASIRTFIVSLDDAHSTLSSDPTSFKMPAFEPAPVILFRRTNAS